MTAVKIERVTSESELDAIEPLWIGLHRHHRAVSHFHGLVPDDQTSWIRRQAHYAALLRDKDA